MGTAWGRPLPQPDGKQITAVTCCAVTEQLGTTRQFAYMGDTLHVTALSLFQPSVHQAGTHFSMGGPSQTLQPCPLQPQAPCRWRC
jgi:hypothetical protein